MFPDPGDWPDGDLVAAGADLDAGTLLEAYRNGLFPMPGGDGLVHWWSPQRRGVLPLGGLRVSRSLRRARRDFEVRVDSAFDEVLAACADSGRDGDWIDDDVIAAYRTLHELGWAHSVETWQDGRLVGGLYGVCIGGLFAGESMFHRVTDASKVALVALVDLLGPGSGRLLDVQWSTDHLASLGVVEIDRSVYLHRLERALELDEPDWTAARSAD